MSDHTKPLHPTTAVLTRGFDPKLSVGSARPAVFRTSTYVFSSPEAAERAFDLMAGLDQVYHHRQSHVAKPDESYARHPALSVTF